MLRECTGELETGDHALFDEDLPQAIAAQALSVERSLELAFAHESELDENVTEA